MKVFGLMRNTVYYNFKFDKLPLIKIANIELTNRCNMQCVFCPANNPDVKGYIQREKKDMDLKDFEAILTRYKKYLDVVSIAWHGESLLHPHFEEIIMLLKKHNVKYCFDTNGSLVSKYIKIFEDYPPEYIEFSLYTVNPEKFKELTKFGDVSLMLDGINKFLEIKKQKKVKTTLIIRTMKMFGYEDLIEEVKEYFKGKDVILTEAILNSWSGRVDIEKFGDAANHLFHFQYCFKPFNNCIIGSDLGVYVCCNHEEVPMGYLNESSLEDIWNSEKYQEIRKNILEGNMKENAICKYCDYANFASIMDRPSLLFMFRKKFWNKFLFGLGLFKTENEPEVLKKTIEKGALKSEPQKH